jgi:hypothetical protein
MEKRFYGKKNERFLSTESIIILLAHPNGAAKGVSAKRDEHYGRWYSKKVAFRMRAASSIATFHD